MRKWSSSIKWLAVVIVVGFFLTSCGGDEKTNSDISGVWKSDDGDTVLNINFSGENKTIDMNGKTMPVTIESDTTKEMIIKVQEGVDNISTWKFKKVWNDNGSEFTFNLSLPDGTHEHFTRETQS